MIVTSALIKDIAPHKIDTNTNLTMTPIQDANEMPIFRWIIIYFIAILYRHDLYVFMSVVKTN